MSMFALSGPKDISAKSSMVGLSVSAMAMSIAHVQRGENGRWQVLSTVAQSGNTAVEHAVLLHKFVEKHALENTPCYAVLGANEYQLTLFEAPSVEEDELGKAMRWLVRDTIDYPIEEAIVDAFLLPESRDSDNAQMAYVVTAKRVVVEKIATLVKQSELTLQAITVPELAMRNLAALHPVNEEGGLFVALHRSGGNLIFLKNGMIHLTRTMEMRLENLLVTKVAQEDSLQRVALNIQRSIDYCASNFRKCHVNKVELLPTELKKEILADFLTNNLGMAVNTMDLCDFLDFEKIPSTEEQAALMMAIGAALVG